MASCSTILICSFVFALFMLVVLFLISVASYVILSAIYNPKLPEFEVESVSVSPFSCGQVTGDWEINFSVRNPNHRMAVSYLAINASLLYRDKLYSQTSIPAFNQEKKHQNQLNDKRIQANFTVSEDGYMGSARTGGLLEFGVSMEVFANFQHEPAYPHAITVYCGKLDVHFLSRFGPGKSFGSKSYRVRE